MADVSKINLPNGTSLNIKDETARESLVPAVTSADNGKVLKATYSGGEGSYSWQSGGGGSTPTLESIGIAYGECTDSSSVVNKTASITGFVLQTGSIVAIRFTNSLSLSGAKTLNVNSTGAKSIMFKNSTNIGAATFAEGAIITFMYDGTYWRIISYTSGVLSGKKNSVTITDVSQDEKYTWNNKSNLSLASTITPFADIKNGAIGVSVYAAHADHKHPSLATGTVKNVTVGTSYVDCEMPVTIEAGEAYLIVATQANVNVNPRGIALQRSGSGLYSGLTETTTNLACLTTQAIIYNYQSSTWTINVFAKGDSSGINPISVAAIKLPR